MKLFGKDLFNFNKSDTMYDFVQFGMLNEAMGFIAIPEIMQATTPTGQQSKAVVKKPKKKVLLSPKGLYRTKALNDNKFVIRTDSKYITEQVEMAKSKLGLMLKAKNIL